MLEYEIRLEAQSFVGNTSLDDIMIAIKGIEDEQKKVILDFNATYELSNGNSV